MAGRKYLGKSARDVAENQRHWRRARRVLWLSSLVILVPLATLLWLQYRWLNELEEASAIARETALHNQLTVVAKEVKLRYLAAAERSLNVSSSILEPKYRRKWPKIFAKRQDPIVRRFFVADFTAPSREVLSFYDPLKKEIFTPEWSPESSAVHMAIAPWHIVYKNESKVEQTFIVEEKEPTQRMILQPVTDEESRLLGMVGMILDEQHLLDEVLPEAVAAVFPKGELQVSVRNQAKQWVFGQSYGRGDEPPIRQGMLFVFEGWHLYLDGPDSAPRAWARANLAANLSLTLVLGVLAVAGLALLLRATSREMYLSEMKNDFVSNVSHELRTPLASVRVFGELLRLGKIKDAAKVREYGEYIEAESRRLTQLIDNILDFSRLESGAKDYVFEEVELGEVLDEMLEIWRIRLEHQGFEIDVAAAGADGAELAESGLLVRADRDALAQALFNLIDNAVKYSGDSKRIELRLESGRGEARWSVRDFGIGISRSEQKRIFDRFHRVGSGLAHDVKGSGLGLALVRHIAAAHGGKVTVKSSLGEGSTFTLHVPLHRERKEERDPYRGAPARNSVPAISKEATTS